MVFESFLGPFFGAINSIVDPFFNFLGPNTFLAVLIIGAIISFITTLANKLLVDQDRLVYLQKEMKEFNQEMMEARKTNDPKAMGKVQKKQAEFMNLQKEMMFMSFKPMIVTFVPIILIFWWISQSQLNQVVIILPKFTYYVLLVPLWHALPFYGGVAPGAPAMSVTWLGWYILSAFGFSLIFRKLMGLKSGGM
jgi:uncharacterized membrane protein (DUF106 family)